MRRAQAPHNARSHGRRPAAGSVGAGRRRAARCRPPVVKASAGAGTRDESTRTIVLGGAALVLLTLVAYLPALGAGFVWDDDFFVTRNGALRTVQGLRTIWFHPEKIGQ